MKGPILHSSMVPRDEHCDLVPSLQPAVLPTLRTLHPYDVSLEMYPHVVRRESGRWFAGDRGKQDNPSHRFL